MSKLAGSVEDPGASVPSVEASDINDGDIINMTKMEQDAQGRSKFHADLPSGRHLESDWVMPDGLRRSRLLWIDAVKQNIIADAQAANDKSIQDRRNRLMEEARLEISESGNVEANKGNTGTSGIRRPPAVAEDPSEYAKAQWADAAKRAEGYAEEKAVISAKEKAAKAAAKNWLKIYEGLK